MDKKDKELEFLRGLEKLKASDVRSPEYTSPLDQDVMKVKGYDDPFETKSVYKVPGATQKINTKQIDKVISGSDFQSKIQSLLKGGGKKALGVLPMAGAIGAALQGDPAMAAEELVMDLPGMEAIRSDSAGMSPEDEAMMLAEIDAQKAYSQSPARMNKLQSLMGRSPASSSKDQALEEIKKELKYPSLSDIGEDPKEFNKKTSDVREERQRLMRLLEKQRD